jgi:hypothetical protein
MRPITEQAYLEIQVPVFIYLTGRQFRYQLPFEGRVVQVDYLELSGNFGVRLMEITRADFCARGQDYGRPAVYCVADGEIYLWPIPDYGANKLRIVFAGTLISERRRKLNSALNDAKARLTIELRKVKASVS